MVFKTCTHSLCSASSFWPKREYLASIVRRFLTCFALVLLLLEKSGLAAPVGFGAETKGGLNGRIIRVTTLASDGPGSLRAAVEADGPRLVVFEVGGQVVLDQDLVVRHAALTVAGQTAPPPGITLVGAGIVIKASDVVLEHLRIRIGDGPGPSPHNRDGISIEGNKSGSRIVENVLIDNCSIAWAIDEGVTFLYSGVRRATIRDSIVAESLSHSLHPKGEHSMAVLVGRGAHEIAVLNNLLAHNTFRNPVVAPNASAFVGNNLIYDFGLHAIHVYGDMSLPAPVVAAVGNVGILGESNRGQTGLVYIPKSADPRTRLFLLDNLGPDGPLPDDYLHIEQGGPEIILATSPPFWPDGFAAEPTAELENAIVDHVGAWPAARDSVDLRIIDQVLDRSGVIIDRPSDVGGLIKHPPTYRALDIPGEFLIIGSAEREHFFTNWLRERRRAVGDFDG